MASKIIYLNKEKTRRLQDKYVYVRHGGKWVQEHRLIVSKFIGRELTDQEVVHHIKKREKTNNSINNLMLFDSQNEHLKFHLDFDKYGFSKRNRRLISERWKKYKKKH